jgi:hypothetical protein
MGKKNPIPVITHTEILSYAIQHVDMKYLEAEKKAKTAEDAGNHEMAELVRGTYPWKEKLVALLNLYRIETGSDFGIEL